MVGRGLRGRLLPAQGGVCRLRHGRLRASALASPARAPSPCAVQPMQRTDPGLSHERQRVTALAHPPELRAATLGPGPRVGALFPRPGNRRPASRVTEVHDSGSRLGGSAHRFPQGARRAETRSVSTDGLGSEALTRANPGRPRAPAPALLLPSPQPHPLGVGGRPADRKSSEARRGSGRARAVEAERRRRGLVRAGRRPSD